MFYDKEREQKRIIENLVSGITWCKTGQTIPGLGYRNVNFLLHRVISGTCQRSENTRMKRLRESEKYAKQISMLWGIIKPKQKYISKCTNYRGQEYTEDLFSDNLIRDFFEALEVRFDLFESQKRVLYLFKMYQETSLDVTYEDLCIRKTLRTETIQTSGAGRKAFCRFKDITNVDEQIGMVRFLWLEKIV